MEFNKMYQKVKFIVRKCEKEYYIQLWKKMIGNKKDN